VTRYALRIMQDEHPSSEPAFRPLRALPRREEATRSEKRPQRNRDRNEPPTVLTQSGVFARVASLEPTLVDARLSLDVDAVDRALGRAAKIAYDPSMAAPTMRERLQEMGEIAEALVRIHGLSMHDGLAPLFGPDTSLSRYLRGVQAWCASFARVCERLTHDLCAGRPADWATLRKQVARAARSHDRTLAKAAATDVALLRDTDPGLRGLVHRLAEQLEQLFAAVDWFEESTRRYIGEAA
jgi:hypothetical protein